MVGARAAALDGPLAEAIEQQIHAIENALESVPGLRVRPLENARRIRLQDSAWQTSASRRTRTGMHRSSCERRPIGSAMLPSNHPDPAKARDSVEKTIRGLLQTIQGLCELRNSYGMASHGRDGFSARLDLRQATLAAQAADTIVSFLYRIHRDALMQTPGVRVYYEDHADFNEAFDRDNEMIRLGDLELLPSRVLFHADREAYKAALNEYITEQ